MASLNLGILAHVDAGKTSLTERLLHHAGVIETIGSVDAGTTATDTLQLERARGITIRSAVVSFAVGDVTVNLIDTPGHPDFIAEVERALAVLDGAILVISAVEGVQAQTRVIMRALRRLQLPTLLFVNKIDRAGADPESVLTRIAETLTGAVVPLGTVTDAGTRAAAYRPGAIPLDVLASHDPLLLNDFVRDEAAATQARLGHALAQLSRRARVYPVLFGSAITGAGVADLAEAVTSLLPAITTPATEEPLSATVFKVDRGPSGDRVAYVRMFSGTLRTRERIDVAGMERKVTGLEAFERGPANPVDALIAGQIGRVRGLGPIRIGDTLGVVPHRPPRWRFAPPTLATVVRPGRLEQRHELHAALTTVAEQDPLIGLTVDAAGGLSVRLYGEVQKEVLAATLATEYGIEVEYCDTTTIHIERPAGTGHAVELLKRGDNPFLATVGLRIDPRPIGSGVAFGIEVEPGSMPYAFFTAVEDTVRATLAQGLNGWEVTDCVVTLTHNAYCPRASHSHQRFSKAMSTTGADFRGLVPLVVMAALRSAGTVVCEPVLRFEVEAPADCYAALLPVLSRLQVTLGAPALRRTTCIVAGEVPAGRVHELQQILPGVTRGEGVLDTEFARYAPVQGPPPSRARTDQNPLDRKEYVLRVNRRV